MEDKITMVGELVNLVVSQTPKDKRSLPNWYNNQFDKFYDLPDNSLNKLYYFYIGRHNKDSRRKKGVLL